MLKQDPSADDGDRDDDEDLSYDDIPTPDPEELADPEELETVVLDEAYAEYFED